jgi:hypothetical protein
MRIVIEIDGVELVRTGKQPEVTTVDIPGLSLGATPPGMIPSDKLLKAAAALAAESAGPAPAEIANLGIAGVSVSKGYYRAAEGAAGAMDAGTGPGAPSEKTPEKKTGKKK